jgi:uncharacterized protein (DUF2384 family)
MATRVLEQLGLDHSGFPDLTDSATRHKLSPAAIAAFFKIAELWELNNDEAMSLLGGVSHGRFYALKRTGQGELTQDELTRVSLLIGIFKALNILFSHELANQWVRRPNSNALFHNEPPRILMTLGGVPGLLTVRRLLDSRRGGR